MPRNRQHDDRRGRVAGRHGLSSLLWVAALMCLAMALPATQAQDSAVAPVDTTMNDTVDVAMPETLAPTLPPFTLDDKRELCKQDYSGYNKALRLIDVSPAPLIDEDTENEDGEDGVPAKPNSKYPRIFCYVNTISPYHKSHAQLVADTWAQRCDKTVFFSNDTGTLYVNKGTDQELQFEVVKMHAPADYWHLWMKHKEVIRYIYDHYRHDYDWFYKADDDAYVIVDNLRAYLRKPEIVNNHKRRPMQLGKRFNLTVPMINIQDPVLKERWWKKWDRWVFNSGGPGYALNRLFIDKFVKNMPKKSCLSASISETQPEDTSTTFCLMWDDVVPWDTRDLLGRPRWHPDNPGGVYAMTPEWAAGYWYDFNLGVGGFKYAEECCSSESIGFHYVKKGGMHHMERMLYFCRTGDDVPDIQTFNRKYNLKTSHNVVHVTP